MTPTDDKKTPMPTGKLFRFLSKNQTFFPGKFYKRAADGAEKPAHGWFSGRRQLLPSSVGSVALGIAPSWPRPKTKVGAPGAKRGDRRLRKFGDHVSLSMHRRKDARTASAYNCALARPWRSTRDSTRRVRFGMRGTFGPSHARVTRPAPQLGAYRTAPARVEYCSHGIRRRRQGADDNPGDRSA